MSVLVQNLPRRTLNDESIGKYTVFAAAFALFLAISGRGTSLRKASILHTFHALTDLRAARAHLDHHDGRRVAA